MTKIRVAFTTRVLRELEAFELDSAADLAAFETEIRDEVVREGRRKPLADDAQIPWVGELRGNGSIRHVHLYPLVEGEPATTEWNNDAIAGKPLTSDSGFFLGIRLNEHLIIVLSYLGAGMHAKLRDWEYQRELLKEADEFF